MIIIIKSCFEYLQEMIGGSTTNVIVSLFILILSLFFEYKSEKYDSWKYFVLSLVSLLTIEFLYLRDVF